MERHWEHFSHQADIGVRGIGGSKEEAFEEAAKALTAVITDPDRVDSKELIHISGEAPDDELCLAEWLNQLIFEMATRRMLFRNFKITFEPKGFQADVWGECVDVAKHQPTVEVKGATYTGLSVEKNPEGFWVVQCVVDV